MVYKTVKIMQMMIEPIAKPLVVLNIDAFTSKPFVRKPFAFSTIEIVYIPNIQMIKTNPILSINGIS